MSDVTGERVEQATKTLRVATWNIHAGIGADLRYDARRIVDVLKEMAADVVALQEVASQEAHADFLHELERETGYHVVAGLLRQRHGSDFGNAILSRYPVRTISHLDLAVGHYEPRGALDVCIDLGLHPLLRVIATHLGLRPHERREQVRRILAKVERGAPHPTLLMGDLNEWYLWGRPLRWLHRYFVETPALSTFPAWRPFLALDRVWSHPGSLLRGLDVHASAAARAASDHLPLVANLEW